MSNKHIQLPHDRPRVFNEDEYKARLLRQQQTKQTKRRLQATDVSSTLDDYRLINDPTIQYILSANETQLSEIEHKYTEELNYIQNLLRVISMVRESRQ